jgi:hypothetical protein
MAEIAIPLLALGSMYVMSNQDKQAKNTMMREGYANMREGYTNMTNIKNELPNVNPRQPALNYPTTMPVSNSDVNKYPKSTQPMDKYFSTYNYQKVEKDNATQYGVGGSVQQNYSLDGNPLNLSTFKHNNMVPFFGAKVKGATANRDVSEGMLDNLMGVGSQQFKKQEQGPLFEPQSNLQYANGAPNMSDFMQSRVNPGLKMSNVKPWEEIRVAPGLNKGFTAEGGNGFNTGLEARDSWLPKTVNELRVDTNPKMTFSLVGHEGPGDAYVKNSPTIQTQGKVEKYTPDTYYPTGPERWLTTTGVEKAQTARGIEVLQDVNRTTTTAEYFGGGRNETDAGYYKSEYEKARRPVLAPTGITNVSAVGSSVPTVADYGVKGYKSLPNNRSTTTSTNNFGYINSILTAVVSPLMDVMRPSRKENVIGSARPYGNANNTTVPNSVVFNPADRTKTTIREMTESDLDCNHLNVEHQNANAYLVAKQTPVRQERDTTNCLYSGGAGPASYAVPKSYEAEYNQHNNVNKTFKNHPNMGVLPMFNQTENIVIDRIDSDRCNNRLWVRDSGPVAGLTYPPTAASLGRIAHTKQTYDENKIGCDRINPDILTAFKNNPYTQSLQSWY